MRTGPSFTPKQFSSITLPEKFYIVLLAFLLGFCSSLSASTGLLNTVKNKPGSKAAFHDVKTGGLSKKTPAIVTLKKPGFMGLPTLSYAGPQTYKVGTVISPLIPTGGGAAAPGYSTSTTILGSGFTSPFGVAVDSKGNVYVADKGSNQVKEIPGGTGTPIVIGTGFSQPEGVAVDAAGNVYVADLGNNQVKEIPLLNGMYGTPVVLGAGFIFSSPADVAVDAKGNVYVADSGHNAVQEIPAGSGAVITLGYDFSDPSGVAVDAYGNVYVGDSGHNLVKKIPAGNGIPVTLGSVFTLPYGVAVDGSGNVFVADYFSKEVKEIPVNGGAIMTVGSGYSYLFGVAADNANNVYVADSGNNNTVDKIQPTGGYYISPALPLGLSFNNTTGAISGTPLAASPATAYTVTAYNQYGGNSTTVNITVNAVTMGYAGPQTYMVGTAITPLIPSGGGAGAPDYSSTTTTLGSNFNGPIGVAADAAGNIYVADYRNNQVKKIPAGSSTPQIIGGTGFSYPYGVAVDASGNVYVADWGNNAVKKIPVGGGAPVTLISGNSSNGDLSFRPYGVAVDAAGNVYVASNGIVGVTKIPSRRGCPSYFRIGFH